jgi:hypothetical protein
MSRIVHLDDGTAIKSDVIECFDAAVQDEYNVCKGVGTTGFWNFVESDMYLSLVGIYSSEYIDVCFDKLATIFEGERV